MLGRHSLPVLRRGRQHDLAAEMVGVGHQQRRVRAVELDRAVLVAGHVEAHGDRDHGAGDEFHRARDMGRDLDRDLRALQRLGGDEPLVAQLGGDAGDAPRRDRAG